MATVMMAMPAPPTTARTGSVTTYHWGRARLVRAVGEVAESVTGPASAYSAWAMPSAVNGNPCHTPRCEPNSHTCAVAMAANFTNCGGTSTCLQR